MITVLQALGSGFDNELCSSHKSLSARTITSEFNHLDTSNILTTMVARIHMFQKQLSKEQKAHMIKEQRRMLASSRTSVGGGENNRQDVAASLSFCSKQFSSIMNVFAPGIRSANINRDV